MPAETPLDECDGLPVHEELEVIQLMNGGPAPARGSLTSWPPFAAGSLLATDGIASTDADEVPRHGPREHPKQPQKHRDKSRWERQCDDH
jgi:hypothetical protein